jgi:CRP-like cAMP-binding protein
MGSYRQSQNFFLGELSEFCFELLRPHLRTVELVTGAVLIEAGGSITQIYFPHNGVVSLVLELSAGEAIDVGMVGREAVIGADALHTDVARSSARVRFPGTASVVDVATFRGIWEASAVLQASLMRLLWRQLGATELIAACNAAHSVEARLCRRLLTARRLAGSDRLPLTQENLAQMLGVRRNSVSLAAITLQQAGLVRYSRGILQIIDIDGLSRRACDCDAADHGSGAGRQVPLGERPSAPL